VSTELHVKVLSLLHLAHPVTDPAAFVILA